MATTRRRSQRSGQRSTSVRVYPAGAGPTPETVPEIKTVRDVKAAKEVDWQAEYAYIGRDLRQLAIVSGLLFALLLVGGLFI